MICYLLIALSIVALGSSGILFSSQSGNTHNAYAATKQNQSNSSTSSSSSSSVENNDGESIKGGSIGICSVGVKSACNGPEFDHP
jgi:hypothetical protein